MVVIDSTKSDVATLVCDQNKNKAVNHYDRSDASRTLTLVNTNPHILTFQQMEYAARGPVITRAIQLDRDLKEGLPLPFHEVIKANLGDAHAMGQRPITFIRQVLALVAYPELSGVSGFPSDVKRKATDILEGCRGRSAGAYSDSRGLQIIREHVAEYIERRDDGIPADPEDVILTAGASEGIRACLKLFKGEDSNGMKAGVMTPVPQYPLYAATLGEYDMCKIDYYLDEANGWTVNVVELNRAIREARTTSNPRAIVVINPGNPTGNVLSRENMEEIIKFAYEQDLFILADEVYQDNIYGSAKFHSFKKVLMEMEAPFNSVELVSFFSASKGFACECGLRGGYFEIVNMDASVKGVLCASVAAKLCPTVLGQSVVDCIVDLPKSFQPSYDLFQEERQRILGELEKKAELTFKTFSSIEGIECQPIEGAMYAFPKILMSQKAIQTARERDMEPDVFYCLELLESTGICVVPGIGVGQRPGTYHFRTTLLPPVEKLVVMMELFKEFHYNFLRTYAN